MVEITVVLRVGRHDCVKKLVGGRVEKKERKVWGRITALSSPERKKCEDPPADFAELEKGPELFLHILGAFSAFV